MTTLSAQWMALSFPNSYENRYMKPIGNNGDIFLNSKTIDKYDFATDTWLKLMDKPIDFPFIGFNSCQSTLDSCKGELWMFHSLISRYPKLPKNKLLHIYLKDNRKCEIHNVDLNSIRSKCALINNKFTVIGGRNNNSIKQWNESTKQFTNITTVYGQMQLARFGLVYDKSSNCLLLFGGYDWYKHKTMDSILQYNIVQNKWHKLPISLPKALKQCECTIAIRNQYVLIFGGTNGYGYYDDIYIYSIKHKTLMISKIKCPSKGYFLSKTVNNEMKDEKTVFGFVRNQWKTSQIEDHYFLPYYLLKMMHEYYLNEFVYLLATTEKTHWKMSTLDIITCNKLNL